MHYKSRLLLLLGEFSKKNSCVTICSILAWGRNFENSTPQFLTRLLLFSLFAKQRHSRTSTGLCQAVSKVMSKYSSLPWYTVHTALKVRFLSIKNSTFWRTLLSSKFPNHQNVTTFFRFFSINWVFTIFGQFWNFDIMCRAIRRNKSLLAYFFRDYNNSLSRSALTSTRTTFPFLALESNDKLELWPTNSAIFTLIGIESQLERKRANCKNALESLILLQGKVYIFS